ncbi:hypothetical protein [Streptomyces spirodelae]|uniref:ATP-binding protein n=1 Tax=Streptomyces spirodelae TaxID=2812904 RepID=A0ABS3WW67_9ACTN|nr:hypothetical protein [Streptomyces spirodelae]MBO8187380.1 hypothetical protein [Streptomyces spirodelae]
MTEVSLSAQEYRDLLSAALEDATAADARPPTARTLFTPDSHRQALYVDNVVVQGGRGVGKTFWYWSLLDDELRDLAAQEYRINRLNRLRVHPGYGLAMRSGHYPGPLVLGSLLAAGEDPYDIWYTVLLNALGQPDLSGLTEWADKMAWVRAHPGPAERTIEQADSQAYEEKIVHLLLFDALEHLVSDRGQADRLVGGILRLALQMRLATRNIRLKVFVRPDMFEAAGNHFADASKLSAYSARLEWTQTDLYGLLFQYLGNEQGEESERFRMLTGGWKPENAGARQAPPRLLSVDENTQRRHFDEIADPFMGSNVRRGKTYTWLPNHLMDGCGQVSPRSFLEALSTAAETTRARHPGHDRALHHEGIRAGVQKASKRRVDEVKEDTHWVRLAIEPLAGYQVPVAEKTVLRLWKEANLSASLAEETSGYVQADTPERVRMGPRQPEDLPRVITELIELGVMTQPRSDGRLDLPDVYRIAFGLGRKGGVPRPTS